MEDVEVRLYVHEDLHVTQPRAETPVGWITFGFHEDLYAAMIMALTDMLDLVEKTYQVDRIDAVALASLLVDLRITQIVNGVRGVHAILPHLEKDGTR
jgi:acetamidase/formamidase